MCYIRFVSAALLAGGLALAGSPGDDRVKTDSEKSADRASASSLPARMLPPVLQSAEKNDTTFVVLPGSAAPDAAPANSDATASARTPGPPPLPPPDLDRPVLHRSAPQYPPEFGTESAVFCQHQIGSWMVEDAIELFGDPKTRRAALSDDGTENGDIFAFSDPSSRYREIELDFDNETGELRTVFAYPWKMSWKECRKVWGARVTSADADKGRMFYSYLDRRMDILVDATGNVISLGLY